MENVVKQMIYVLVGKNKYYLLIYLYLKKFDSYLNFFLR